MAKKGAAIQLQTDVYTDEDWDKLLDKIGLIVIDVYSEWCGQCSAMSAILKKLKLEIGGDIMHIAAAKCDNIKVLERFREKSEPTWMFISDRKVVNILFGANAPKLIGTITNELRREKESREGLITRTAKDPDEPSGEEEERYEKKEAVDRAIREAEAAATLRELQIRRDLEAEALLSQFNEVSILLAWPHAKDKALEIMQEQFEKYGLSIGQREKPVITNEDIELIEYFADGFIFPEISKNAIVGKKAMAWLIKGGEDPSDIDSILNIAVYGPSKEPPGDPGYPAYILRHSMEDEIEDVDEKHKETEDTEYICGLWCAPNSKTKAMAIRAIFKHLAGPHLPAEPEEIPPHIAMVFDAFKRIEVMALANDYPIEVMRFGFFTDENADTAKLIAKTVPKFEKYTPVLNTEKLVIQLSKKRCDPVLAFAQLGPSFMSTNAVEGGRECKLFFPDGYDIPEEEEVIEEVKKHKKKKKAAGAAMEADVGIAEADVETTKEDATEIEIVEIEGDEREVGEQEEVEQNDDDDVDDNEENEEESQAGMAEEEITKDNREITEDNREIKEDNREITQDNREITQDNTEIIEDNREITEEKNTVDADNEVIDVDKATNTTELVTDELPSVVVDDDMPPPPD